MISQRCCYFLVVEFKGKTTLCAIDLNLVTWVMILTSDH